MQVFKFGGASVKDAKSIQNTANIIANYKKNELLVVVSAIGKTTNMLENLVHHYFNKSSETTQILEDIKQFHFHLIAELFGTEQTAVFNEVANQFVEVEWIIEEDPQDSFSYIYDQIVSIGELVSSKIVCAYLKHIDQPVKWIDARDYIFTDNKHREAVVDWKKTEEKISAKLPSILAHDIIITQGFIGSTSENFTTTLGREGSDFSAAIFGSCLNAEKVTIWKDVPGVLNADPKWFDHTELIPELSYTDAIELTYYGATVIHPKTIKPLQNKNISLHVRSFIHPENEGTVIRSTHQTLPVPSFIFKVNQVFISVSPKDFSFIIENNLRDIFDLFHQHHVKMNMMRNTAINFTVAVDDTGSPVEDLLKDLETRFNVFTEHNLELITIRYYNQETINRVLLNKEVISELKDKYTCQLLVKNV